MTPPTSVSGPTLRQPKVSTTIPVSFCASAMRRSSSCLSPTMPAGPTACGRCGYVPIPTMPPGSSPSSSDMPSTSSTPTGGRRRRGERPIHRGMLCPAISGAPDAWTSLRNLRSRRYLSRNSASLTFPVQTLRNTMMRRATALSGLGRSLSGGKA